MPVEAKRITRNIGSFHQSHEPRVLCVIANVSEAVELIVKRIRREQDDRGCGSYLYLRQDGTAYLIREDQTAAERWIREHFDWLVGFYTRLPNPNKGLSTEASGMAEDIAEHLQQFSAADGRQCVGYQQEGVDISLQSATGVAASQRSEAPTSDDLSSPGGGAFSGVAA